MSIDKYSGFSATDGFQPPGTGELKALVQKLYPSDFETSSPSAIPDESFNLKGVFESFVRLSGGQPTAGENDNPIAGLGFFNPGFLPGGLPASADEIKKMLNKEPQSNLSHAAKNGFSTSSFSDYSFGRDQEITYNGRETFDVPAIRKDFPILNQKVNGKDLIWFDNAATTQKPQAVIDAISRFYQEDNSNIHRAAHTLAARSTDAYENARDKVRDFIGASSSEEIIFVRGTTEGINLIVQTFGKKFIQPGDEIIISTLDHHANIVPWQQFAKERGAILKAIPINNNGDIILEDYEKLLGPRTRIVSIAHVNNTFGTIAPVKAIIEGAHKWGARVLLDGAQSVPHSAINVQELDVDFFVFSGHKIYAPTGIGVVYGKKSLLEIMPHWQGGGNMIEDVTLEEIKFNGPPARFEAGTPNIADAVGLGAALDYITRIGIHNISKYEHELTEYARAELAKIEGLRLIGNPRERISVISLVLDDIPTPEVGRLLNLEGIALRSGHHCAQPSLRRMGVEETVRPSFSFYNTKEEIDKLVAALRNIKFNRQR
jgi:cysteine desulfurase / selenocysteine lyase